MNFSFPCTTMMADPIIKQLLELAKQPGNNMCADCEAEDPEWAVYNIGIFICTKCAGIHRNMGCNISRVKSLKLDKWGADQLQTMIDNGNLKVKQKYEMCVPMCYRIPNFNDCFVLLDQWIRAKYDREEFIYTDKQIYTSGTFECYLWKRGRDDEKFQERKFVLSEADNTLVYYIKENKDPKAIIRISDVNATFVPEKLGHPNGLQLSYVNSDGSTRHIFVHSNDGKVIVDFYTAIRSAKFNRLKVAFPLADETELSVGLTRDFLKEGHLWKTGPKRTDGYKKRWFTLDDRKLMYMEGPRAAYAKGEIFIGCRAAGYSVLQGVPPGSRDHGFSFTLKTPDRKYLLSAETCIERTEWMTALDNVIGKPLTPQDCSLASFHAMASLKRKRKKRTPLASKKKWATAI